MGNRKATLVATNRAVSVDLIMITVENHGGLGMGKGKKERKPTSQYKLLSFCSHRSTAYHLWQCCWE